MNNKFTYKGIEFEIANYNARKNEFEQGNIHKRHV